MEKTLMDLWRRIKPLSREQKQQLEELTHFLEVEDVKTIKYFLRLKRIGFSSTTLKLNKQFKTAESFPQLINATEDEEVTRLVPTLNNRITKRAEERAFHDFSQVAQKVLPSLIAPTIVGMDDAKLVASWQLFSKERFHLLLLGDPGTGKTEILRGASQFAPISSFGLGSGTSGAGLSAATKGKKLTKGLLPQADNGVCCIDELNLMKTSDRGALLNAMEKGFVTYDKASSHVKLQARVCILATANPKGDRFIGNKIDFLQKQIPFDPALLSRFHVVFFIRRPNKKQFLEITKNLLSAKQKSGVSVEDVDFIRNYVAFAKKLDVDFDKNLEPIITDFFDDLKSREDELFFELSPRLVLGVVRMAKAIARMSLRSLVIESDVKLALDVFERSLKIEQDEVSKKHKKR